VTAANGYWLVALGKGSSRIRSIRGPLGRGLNIWVWWAQFAAFMITIPGVRCLNLDLGIYKLCD